MNDQQLLRYSRHLLLPQLDIDGQQALLDARVLVVGLGGLGSPVALYLAASGIGHLVLVDDDNVELSNLQRQIAHNQTDVGANKAQSAAEAVRALNPDVNTTVFTERLGGTALCEQISQATVVVDCTDNLSARLQLNQATYNAEKILVSGAAIGTEGQLLVVDGKQQSACYRCLYDEHSDQGQNCATSGVLAPLVGVIGASQAVEVIKAILGQHQTGRLQIYDAWAGSWRSFTLPKDPACPVCRG